MIVTELKPGIIVINLQMAHFLLAKPNTVRCEISAVLMLRIQIFWVIMLNSRVLMSEVLKEHPRCLESKTKCC
jgi:hypothetical protein